MNFKKKISGSWTDTPHYIHNTSTDTITTLPAVIHPTGTTATVGLKGNTLQSSIPSPTSPVMPRGTGERTGNLFDISTLENGIYLAANGNKYGGVSDGVRGGTKIKVLPNTTYTLSAQSSINVSLRILEWSNGTFTNQTPKYNISGSVSLTVTTTAETTEIAFNIEGVNGQYATNIMLNTGSMPLPYEPYGYKIPISSANTTMPVYLGEVQTTRRIKKLVLTGEENITSGHLDYNLFNIPVNDYLRDPIIGLICTHYGVQKNVVTWTAVSDKCTCFYVGLTVEFKQLYIMDSSYSTIADFKSYLAAQYAAGTPVTVWYVLAEPTTGIVNEPIRKIGDYADEVSGITIPTIAGANTLSIGTTLQPSEVSVNYHGWHPVQSVHEKSKNLFDENYSDISGTIQYSPLYVGEGSFTLSTTTPYDSNVANVFLLSGNVSTGASTVGNGAWLNHNVTSQSVDGYVTIAYRHYTSTTSPVDCQTMLNSGSTPLPYEPYWT